jgi:hypothetical protein
MPGTVISAICAGLRRKPGDRKILNIPGSAGENASVPRDNPHFQMYLSARRPHKGRFRKSRFFEY